MKEMKTTLKQFDDFIETFMGRLEQMGLNNNIMVSFSLGPNERTINTAGDMTERVFAIQVPAEHIGKTRREGDAILSGLATHKAHEILFRDLVLKGRERYLVKQDMDDALRNAVKALDIYVAKLERLTRLRPLTEVMERTRSTDNCNAQAGI